MAWFGRYMMFTTGVFGNGGVDDDGAGVWVGWGETLKAYMSPFACFFGIFFLTPWIRLYLYIFDSGKECGMCILDWGGNPTTYFFGLCAHFPPFYLL